MPAPCSRPRWQSASINPPGWPDCLTLRSKPLRTTMKLPLFNHLRDAAQHLFAKGPAAATAAIQQALNGKHAAAANNTQSAQNKQSAQPAMRDINPPPGGATMHAQRLAAGATASAGAAAS